jgi:protein involved in polysaccharide export with SLBB domain
MPGTATVSEAALLLRSKGHRFFVRPKSTSWRAGVENDPASKRLKQLIIGIMAAVTIVAAGCASQNVGQQPPASVVTADDPPDSASPGADQQLQELRRKRLNDSFIPLSTIAAGDVVQVSVPDVEEIKEKTERVSPEGTITLPISGSVYLAGLTEEQANNAVRAKLSKLVKDPEVDTLVLKHSNRQVAVVGMVNKPGLYALNSRNDTILDMIARAGGMAESAGSSLVLVPASQTPAQSLVRQVAATESQVRDDRAIIAQRPDQPLVRQQPARAQLQQLDGKTGPDPAFLSAGLPHDSSPIVIGLASSNESSLDVPVRPGDMIIVPARGEVLVQGWVQRPGAYQIIPGMTALGAVTAAGGQLFSSSAKVLRAGVHSEKIEIPVDLSKVEHGQQPDVTVQSGDVIIVARSVTGAVPYALYTVFSKFGAGLALPVY